MNRAKDFATRYAPDPYTSLLMHFQGTDNGTVFAEETGKSINVVGNAVTSTSQSKFGGVSGYFPTPNGTQVTTPDSPDLNFGSADFTIEFWIYIVSWPADHMMPFVKRALNKFCYQGNILKNSHYFEFACTTNGATQVTCLFPVAISSGQWEHIAIVRSGNTLAAYFNGTKSATTFSMTGVTIYNADSNLQIGGLFLTPSYYYTINGYIDEFRISKGIARWTSNFTPPTSPYAR